MATGRENFRAALTELASGHAHLGQKHIAQVLRSLADNLDPTPEPEESKGKAEPAKSR